MTRVLYVCPYYKPAYVYGGPVNSISSLCEGLVRVGVQVAVFTTNANGATILNVPLQEPVDMEGVAVWYHPMALKGFSFFFSPALVHSINRQISNFDIVVADSLWSYPLIPAAKACKRFNIRYVIPARGQLTPWALASKPLKKITYLELIGRGYANRAAGIHCTDVNEAEEVKKLGFRVPTFVVPNSINVASFRNLEKTGNFRRQFGIPNHAILLLFLGRITQIKRPDIAVDTLGALRSMSPEVHLVLAGPDIDRSIPKLRDQASILGCNKRLHFTGLLNKEAVISALIDTDLLLMPSEIQENFGMSALEAMAAGVPILVSDGVPVGRWANKVGAGRVISCTKQAFQQATIELLSNPDLLKEMGQRGKTMACRYFDVEVVARQMLAQYQSIIRTGQPLPT